MTDLFNPLAVLRLLLMVGPFLALPLATLPLLAAPAGLDKQGAGFVLLVSLQRSALN